MNEYKDTPFAAIGGHETIEKLVETFYYKKVARHPDLAPIFPDDLRETALKQKRFLTQFLGGPPLYLEHHGHPMLRARHLPFPITPRRADAWLACMQSALEETGVENPWREAILHRLAIVARRMVNTDEQAEEKGE